MVDKNSKRVKGALITNYLLEKSRVISQSQAERNYHIFYFLFKGANKDLLDDLNLSDIKNYDYLKKNNCFSVSTISDLDCFIEVTKSFEVMNYFKKYSHPLLFLIIYHLISIDFKIQIR